MSKKIFLHNAEDGTTSSFVKHMKILRWVGCSPLIVDPPTFSKISVPILLVSGSIYVSNVIRCVKNIFLLDKVDFMNISLSASGILLVLAPLLSTMEAILNRFILEKAANDLISIQNRLGATNYNLFAPIKIMLTGPVVAAITIVIRIAFISNISDMIHELYSLQLFFTIHSAVVRFAYWTHCIGDCFVRLSRNKLMVREESIAEFMKTCVRLENLIADINKAFDACLTWNLAIIFCFFVIQMFLAIEYGERKPSIWAALVLWHFGVLLYSCQNVVDMARNCNSAFIRTVSQRKFDWNRTSSLVLLSYLIGRNRPAVIAFKTIVIEYGLLFSMLSGLMTYVILLYQLHLSFDDHHNIRLTNVTPAI
ncbi:Hypothetical protein NTJ_01610 [Nesidiocoris tenuis]|uniref:Gustatory receptor n=1 Tax=Nesidiocoris tenuis TaxID=355587 RepID=A0ABN7A9X8_9HEMI|nr:Hypothetical protein NTJ_01610 [Nesidiocoris tenuis]